MTTLIVFAGIDSCRKLEVYTNSVAEDDQKTH